MRRVADLRRDSRAKHSFLIGTGAIVRSKLRSGTLRRLIRPIRFAAGGGCGHNESPRTKLTLSRARTGTPAPAQAPEARRQAYAAQVLGDERQVRFLKTLHRLILCALVMASCVSCDQVTKSVAKSRLEGTRAVSCLGGTVRLIYAENPGAFLSLGASLPPWIREWLFLGLTVLLVVGIVAMLIRDASLSRGKAMALSLVAAGGVGNLIDRLTLGIVRDFLNVGLGPVRTGIFNVADLAITAGLILLVGCSALSRRRRPLVEVARGR